MKLHLRGTLIVLFITSIPFMGVAQQRMEGMEKESQCVRKLDDAKQAYDDGLLEKVEGLISGCVEGNQLNKDEKLDAYRLIALAKLYDEDEAGAEDAMIKFLRIDPEYQIQQGIDPKEFAELYDNYHTSPLYTIGVQFGINFTQVNSYLERGIYNTETEKKDFSSNVGIQFGIKVSRYIYNGLNVNLDLLYAQNTFSYTHEIMEGSETITVDESQGMLNVPLTFSYTFRRDKSLKPFIEAGIGLRYLFSSSVTPTKEIEATIPGSSNDRLYKRNNINFEGVFGAGLKYKIPRGDVYMSYRYTLGLGNQRKTGVDEAIKDDDLMWNFHVTDNDFSINNMILTIGYNFYLYKPRKKKGGASSKIEYDEPKPVKEQKESTEKNSKKSSGSNDDGGKRRVIE